MSTIFDIRQLRLPKVSAGRGDYRLDGDGVGAPRPVAVGMQLYRKLTNNTVVAYFPEDACAVPRRQGSDHGRAGRCDRQDRTGRRPDASHVALQQRIQGARQRDRRRSSTPVGGLAHHSAGTALQRRAGAEGRRGIPIERTQVPVEWDELRDHQRDSCDSSGPTAEQPKGPFGEVIEAAADNLAGKGKQINDTLNSLSDALSRAERGPRRLLRDHAKPGAVRQRAATRTISSSSR